MRRVVITGLGVVTSIGTGWQEFWQSLLEGRSGISRVTSIDTSDYPTHLGGEVKGLRADDFLPEEILSRYCRATQLALVAVIKAIEDASLRLVSPVAITYGITTGPVQVIETINDKYVRSETPYENPHLFYQLPPNTTVSAISEMLNIQGPTLILSTACAAGNYAIGWGFDLIRLGRVDLAICCASDAFSRISFTGFNQFRAVAPERCQPFDRNRKGMMVAEGAGAIVLEEMERAIDRRARIYGEVIGYGLSCDASHMTLPSVEGVVSCMRKALKEAGIGPEDVDYISAHGTGTPANDRTESEAIKRVFGERYRSIPVSSIKSMIGHTMGAASLLEAITCALVVKNDIIPPTINFETPDPECDIDCVPNKPRKKRVNVALNNSYAFGGNNASVVIKKWALP